MKIRTKTLFIYYKLVVKSLSRVRLFVIPWTVAHQVPPSMGFSRREYWSGLSFPSPGGLPHPGIEPGSPALQTDSLPSEPPGKSQTCRQEGKTGGRNVAFSPVLVQIQCSPFQITHFFSHRIRTKYFTIYVETPKTPNTTILRQQNTAEGIRF